MDPLCRSPRRSRAERPRGGETRKGPGVGIIDFANLLKRTADLYARQDLFGAVAKASGASLDEVRSAREWTEVVRDSRNVVHFTVATPGPEHLREGGSTLPGAVPNLRVLLSATRAAAAQASQ